MWYDTFKRDLPWRGDPDPYHILVSEIMLQQTRHIWLIDVQHAHVISTEIARRTGIRHESPQMIVLSDGAPC